MKRILVKEIGCCNECPYVDAISINCLAHVYCNKAGGRHPADGKDGTELMYLEIPDWCPLPMAGQTIK